MRDSARNLLRFELRRCASESRIAATATLIALRGFVQERGALPSSLKALVPDYLDADPLDHFDGRPLRYAPDRRVLWSVGEDLWDGGGESGDSDAEEPPDLVFPICCP